MGGLLGSTRGGREIKTMGLTQYRKDTGPVGESPEEATKMIRRLEHLSYEERLRELRLFSLEKAPGRPYCSLSILKGGLQERRGQTF